MSTLRLGKKTENKNVPDVIFKEEHVPEEEWNNCGSDIFWYISTQNQQRPLLSIAGTSSEEFLISKRPTPPKLHRLLSVNDIEELNDYFKSQEGKLTPAELRKALEKYRIYYTNEDFDVVFLKINTDRDWLCSWDEFITYLIFGLEDDEGDQDKEELDPPIKERPITRRTRLRHQIVKITYCPTVQTDRSVKMSQGSYVVAATDGTVNYYTLDWELQRTGQSASR